MIVRDVYIPGVTIWKIKGKLNKFVVRKDNCIYYLKEGAWKAVHVTEQYLQSIPFYRYSSYSNKSFEPYKEAIYDFIIGTWGPS